MSPVDYLTRLSGRTSDPGEADELLLAADGHFAFASEPGDGFLFDMEQEGDADLTVAQYSIGGSWENEGGFDTFCVATVTAGTYGWEIDGQRGDAYHSPFMLRPGHDFSCVAADIELTNFYLSQRALTEVARTTYADDRIEVAFDDPTPVSARHSAHIFSLANVASEYMRTGALRNPLIRASLFHSLAVSTLECFRLSSDVRERPLLPAERQQRFRQATAFIDDYASLPITLGDVASAAGTTLTQLDRIFRENTGGSAAVRLQRVRLEGARDELAARPAAFDMGALAERWGFRDEGRFTRRYREVFREGPGENLRG